MEAYISPVNKLLDNLPQIVFHLQKNAKNEVVFIRLSGKLAKEINLNTQDVLGKNVTEVFTETALLTNVEKAFAGENIHSQLQLFGKNLLLSIEPFVEEGMVTEIFGSLAEMPDRVKDTPQILLTPVKETDPSDPKTQYLKENLYFAKRMQQSILPPMDTISRYFPQIFILSNAKEILSGDFYWYAQQFDRLFLAVFDCGANGVPGAFLSILQYSLLNQVVNEGLITQSEQVVKALDQKTHNLLYSETIEQPIEGEGIAVAFCNFTKNLRSIRFCGADMNLYLIRRGKLQTFHGLPQRLGKTNENNEYDPAKRNFQFHTVPITLGDTIYFFTNGITNQICEKTQEIIGEQKLINYLISIEQAPLDKQTKLIQNFITAERGNLPQTDDQMIMGIRF